MLLRLFYASILLFCATCPALADEIQVVGHRGTRWFAPENTLPAFEKAIELGADLVEMDVRQTADGVLVIMHDATVDRTTDGRGRVDQLTLADLRKLDAGSWFAEGWKGTRVPTFREVLRAIRGRALPDVDLKDGDPAKVREELLAEGFLGAESVTLYSTFWSVQRRARALDPKFAIRPDPGLGPLTLGWMEELLDPPLVNIPRTLFSREFVADVHARGRKAFVELLGSRDVLKRLDRAIEAQADYVQTDHLEIVLPYLRALGLHR